MVLLGKRHRHLGQMLQGVPRKILPVGQNKCPVRENIKFPADGDGIHLEAWERLQEYIQACPHHGMDEWLVRKASTTGSQ